MLRTPALAMLARFDAEQLQTLFYDIEDLAPGDARRRIAESFDKTFPDLTWNEVSKPPQTTHSDLYCINKLMEMIDLTEIDRILELQKESPEDPLPGILERLRGYQLVEALELLEGLSPREARGELLRSAKQLGRLPRVLPETVTSQGFEALASMASSSLGIGMDETGREDAWCARTLVQLTGAEILIIAREIRGLAPEDARPEIERLVDQFLLDGPHR